ncbi:hypothetical protein Tsubulata_048423 [Turnera subulata]|uniref:DC1 domain-containing protein n=1 Tax=Turnera subulata TaxID=218843 RepID=A0A9Q0FS25_9ROSI|nr:hypothetical protein Tsubulata_048423 [Turnera subulata]
MSDSTTGPVLLVNSPVLPQENYCVEFDDADDVPGESYDCLICGKGRYADKWFYRCRTCNFHCHTKCLLGEYPYIKFGSTHTFECHPHPLTLLEVMTKDDLPKCSACGGEGCHTIAFECTDAKCKFVVGFSCLHQLVNNGA